MHRKKRTNKSEELLAVYAMRSSESKGRVYPEAEHSYRSCYQRDRDRIIHSAAFRRLEYKTQVFVNHEGDYYRTRLTHTLEVSQIARTIASALRLNSDLTEAISLAHDVGHTAFGHSGEEALNELMLKEGGFNHNAHGLRVVDYLEERYPHFPGLNLTWEVREGIIKHSTLFDVAGKVKEFAKFPSSSLEAQVVDIADEIAYDNHDLDDGLASGLIVESDLLKIGLWRDIDKRISKEYGNIPSIKKRYLIIRSLIDLQVTDLIKETEKNILLLKPVNSDSIRRLNKKVVTFSSNMLKLRVPLKDFLLNRLYHHFRVVRMSIKAKRFIQELFKVYLKNPKQLPLDIQERIAKDGAKRAVCDYIAAMTDRYALDEYKKLFTPYEAV
ncbi:MAG: deoxyguanosinetriphosphate triphosphohydrolase [Candidatus Omnitrophota bacterium]